MAARPLTGRTVLVIVLSSFGVIIGVNLVMAYLAVGTFPGLEVRNTYVASQSFDSDRDAQEALGWDVAAGYADGTLTLSISDNNGDPVPVAGLSASIGRATHANADVTLDFAAGPGPYRATIPLDHGKWELRLHATAADGTAFRQRLAIIVTP
ncbi:MAG: FixH family protein [Rhodobacteraceae bacterium]|nr:FixH family protein [Paracoccaceae bacterium]